MLHLVEIFSDYGGLLTLPVGSTNNGLILRGVEGLEPVKASINLSDFAAQDGARFHSSRRGSRNIRIGLSLDPRFGGTTRELRKLLYSVIMPETPVLLKFHLENDQVVQLRGVVESVDSPMFTDKPAAIVSIICPDPDFEDLTIYYGDGEGYTNSINKYTVEYTGDVPTGFALTLYLNVGDPSSGFTIHHWAPDGTYSTLIFAHSLLGDDNVTIETTPGKKKATLDRDGTQSSILEGITPHSVWTMLYPGTNEIAVTTTGGQFYYEYFWTNKYGGL